ncbi:MAG: hypothetical protein C4586_00340 [Anaerolineaceae bacterium]|nr:MAG: hypothetical protein C4586_00340 [Anaerolineaceae bacterium]
MHKNIPQRWQVTELSYSALVLVLLLWFTYGIFIRAPYIGLYFHPTNGSILQTFVPSETLHLGDILIKVGDISWQDYFENSRQGLFNDVKGGDTVDIIVNRNGQEITVQWKIPGFNLAEFYSRFFNVWWLAYIFWFFGFTTQIFVRPKDTRWRLLVALNYLTGLWVILGSLSARHLWESSILLRATTWMLLPIYLHFHWLFPKPLRPAPKFVTVILYAASLSFILGELVQIFPKTFYALGFLSTLTGVVVLQVIHFIGHREQRREVGLAALAILLAILPSAALSVSGVAGTLRQTAIFGLLTLPFMPLTYFYVIYRSQLGGLEMRANRFISLYAFLIILSTILIILIAPAISMHIPGEMSILLALSAAILATIISTLLFPAFQAFVEKQFLGITLPYQHLQEAYSGRITSRTSLSSLLQLLNDEVFPSLLVRQFAFMQVFNGNLKALLTRNIDPEQLPDENIMNELASQVGKYLPKISPDSGWMRLVLPLKAGDSFIGFWLLGRRDPDDLYPQAEIPILQSLANQTATALSNIQHAEQLRKMYQSDIERYEKERMRLALELHDSILNELAILRTNLDETNLSLKFQTSYEELTRRLREIVSDLRPPMLMYGLISAIEELADNLMERSGDKIKIKVDMRSGDERLPQNIEQHLFRIVQEACENALRHAQAKNIAISGTLAHQRISMVIEDDGAGFDTPQDLNSLIINQHFGLAGMVERAHLIGAEINLQSRLNTGTKIRLTWADNAEKS